MVVVSEFTFSLASLNWNNLRLKAKEMFDTKYLYFCMLPVEI